MKTTIIAAILACVFAANAEARHRSPPPSWGSASSGCDMSSGRCGLENSESRSSRVHSGRFKASRHTSRARHFAQGRVSRVRVGQGSHPIAKSHPEASYEPASRVAQGVVDHPSRCPHRAYCGCCTALYLLGKHVVAGGLAIASNWLRFPHAACAPRMAAAGHGHVFAIIECLPDNKALAYDPNSGGHRTRIHVRSLAGYRVVNPHGAMAGL